MASRFDVRELTKLRLQETVFETLPKNNWYACIVDRVSVKVLSTHMKQSDLLDYNISVVDPIDISRKESANAVYFVSPSIESVTAIIGDFQRPKPMYDHAYIFFTSKLPDRALSMIKSCTPLLNRLGALKEVHVEFTNVDARTFCTEQPDALASFFGEEIAAPRYELEYRKCAQRLATLFTTLKARPGAITVRTPSDVPQLPGNQYRSEICRKVGEEVLERLNRWALKDASLFPGPVCDLIIVDRAHDPVAPVMHPFHYASVIHDLVTLEDNKVFKYTWADAKGAQQHSEHVLDSSDDMWHELRHAHIAEAAKIATARLEELESSKTARFARAAGQANMRDLGKATEGLPEFLAKKAQLSMHYQLAGHVFSQINERDLIELGRLEQELVFGEKKSKDIIALLQKWNAGIGDGKPTTADKMRLLLSYVTTHPGKLDTKSQENWSGIAHIDARDMHTICNVQYLGVELQKPKRSAFSFSRRNVRGKAVRQDKRGDNDDALENGRFQPLLLETVDSFVAGILRTGPKADFDTVRARSEFDAALVPEPAPASVARSVRTSARTQPTWHKSAAQGGAGARPSSTHLNRRVVVIFVVGGCTWSEVQAAHELSQQHGIEVLLGSTNIIESGEDFLKQLYTLSPLDQDHLAFEIE